MLLGTTYWMIFVFALCSTRLLYGGPIYVMAALAVASCLPAARSRLTRGGALRALPSRLRSRLSGVRPSELPLIAALAATLAALFVASASPAPTWDADTYHLTVPKLYIEEHGFFRIPFSLFSNWPMYVDLLYLLAMMLADYVQAAMIHYGFGLLCLVAMARCCRAEGSRLAGLLAAALFLGNGIVLFEFPIAYVDLAFTFFFLMAFLLAATGIDRDSPFHLVLAGLCCGVLAGTKLSGILALASVAALVLPHALRGGPRVLLRTLLALGLPCLIAVPWYVKAYLHTGNPVYPFMYGLFGGPEWNAELARQLAEWNERIGMGKSLGDYLLLPLRVVLMGGPTYGEFGGTVHPAWIVLLPASAAVAVRDRTVRRCLLASAVYFVAWSLGSQQMRLLMPVLPLLSIAAALAVVRLAERLGAPGRRALVEGILPAVFAVYLTAASWDELQQGRRLLATYLVHGDGVRAMAVPPVYGFINHRLPPASRILFLNTNHAFFCDRDYISDSAFEASQMQALLSPAETEDELRRLLEDMGITHVYFKRMNWGIDYPPSLWRFINSPRHVRRIFASADGMDLLFRILPADGSR